MTKIGYDATSENFAQVVSF